MVAIGSASVDTFINIDKGYKDINRGDKVLITDTFSEVGGGATNAACTLANFGLRVKLIVKIGNDHNARIIEDKIKTKKISFHKIVSQKYKTPFSVILSSKKDGDRVVYAYKGAADFLSERDFKLREINGIWIYLSSFVGASFYAAKRIALYSIRNRINVLFNPSTYLASKGKKKLKQILESTYILIMNKEESQLILGRKAGIKDLLVGLKNLGPKIVIITDGPNDLYAIDEKCSYKMKPYKGKVVSTLGAGDAFASGFLASYVRNGNIEISIRMGLANARSVLTKFGANSGILNYREAYNFIQSHRSKLEEHCKIK